MAKRRPPKGRQSRKAFIHDEATAQTRAKLRRDPVQELARLKTIAPIHEQAAREIDNVFTAKTKGLWAKVQDPSRASRGSGDWEDWPESLKIAAKRYDAWANKLSHEHHNGAPPLLETAIAMVVDGRTGNDIDAERKQRKGTASGWLVKALKRYAAMAGWTADQGEGKAA